MVLFVEDRKNRGHGHPSPFARSVPPPFLDNRPRSRPTAIRRSVFLIDQRAGRRKALIRTGTLRRQLSDPIILLKQRWSGSSTSTECPAVSYRLNVAPLKVRCERVLQRFTRIPSPKVSSAQAAEPARTEQSVHGDTVVPHIREVMGAPGRHRATRVGEREREDGLVHVRSNGGTRSRDRCRK